MRPQEHVQHHFAFGDEQALAAHEIALAHVAIGRDARIVRIVDGDDIGHDPCPAHGLRAAVRLAGKKG